MKELEITIKEINKSIFEREQVKIPTLNEDDVYSYILSFKKLDLKLENAKQKLIDMFVNRVILFDKHYKIHFNISGNKGTKLSLSEKSDI